MTTQKFQAERIMGISFSLEGLCWKIYFVWFPSFLCLANELTKRYVALVNFCKYNSEVCRSFFQRLHMRVGGRVVECSGLENQRARKRSGGSNPSPPATILSGMFFCPRCARIFPLFSSVNRVGHSPSWTQNARNRSLRAVFL